MSLQDILNSVARGARETGISDQIQTECRKQVFAHLLQVYFITFVLKALVTVHRIQNDAELCFTVWKLSSKAISGQYGARATIFAKFAPH